MTPSADRQQEKETKWELFVPAFVDDLGLTAPVFRVYARIWRRAGRGGQCTEAVPSIAAGCHINRKTVMAALRELLARGMIRRIQRAGVTSAYQLVPPPWTGQPGPKEAPGSTLTQPNPVTHPDRFEPRHVAQKRPRDPAQKRPHEGSPVLPGRESQEGGAVAPPPAHVGFPWESAEDPNLPPTIVSALGAAFPDPTERSVAFRSIRGRKIKHNDQHTAADWADVVLSEIESHPRARKPERNSRAFSQAYSFAGITDREPPARPPTSPAPGADAPPENWHSRLKALRPDNVYTDPASDRYTTNWSELPIEARRIVLSDEQPTPKEAA